MSLNPIEATSFVPDKDDLEAIYDHESELECFFKRYSAFNVCQYIGPQLKSNSSVMVLNVPHFAVRLIEASCRYQREYRDKVYTKRDHYKALNIVTQWNDPLLMRSLESQKDIMLFGKIAEHQQLKMQLVQLRERYVIGRAIRILRSHHMNRAWELMEKHTGLSATTWLAMLVGGAGQSHHNTLINYNEYDKLLRMAPRDTYERFLSIVSFTPSVIRNRYMDLRVKTRNAMYWSTIIPYVWSKPFINFGDSGLFSAIPAMIMRHAERGLAGLLPGRDGEVWDREYSRALEAYVEEQLCDCFGNSCVYRLDGNKKISNDTMLSDYVVDVADSRIYIEVKSVRDRRTTFMPHEIPSVRYTEQIRKAVGQVRSSAARDREITDALGMEVADKPIYGLILLQDDGVANNSPWFWNYGLQLKRGVEGGRDADGVMASPPQIASVDILDLIRHILKNTAHTFRSLISDQEEKDRSLSYGDWISELERIKPESPLELERSSHAFDEFLQEIRPILES